MKKLITALMILVTLLCFTSCKPEPDTSNPFEGYYVQSLTMCGQPVNIATIIVKGNTIEMWELSYPDIITETKLGSLKQEHYYSGTITVKDNYFTLDGYKDTFSLQSQAGITFLAWDDAGMYQKVDAGTTSSLFASTISMDFYFADNGDYIGVSTWDNGDEYEYDFEVYIAEDDESYIGHISAMTTDKFTLSFYDEDFSGTLDVSFTNAGATISNCSITGNAPADNYTKYVRSTAWPTA